MATFPRSRGSRSVTSPPKRSLILTGLEQVPFRSANPDQLHEVTMDNQPEVFSPTASPRGAIISPVRARTIKEYDQQIADLRKENFNLKLKLYFLEEKMEKKFDGDSKELHRVNIKLQVDVATLHKELEQKHKLLQDALGTLEKLEYNHRKEMEELKKKTNDRKTQLQGEITVFEQELQFNSKPRERESDVEDHCSEAYKQAFGLDLNHTCPLNDVPNDSSDMEKRRLKQLVNELKAIISKKDEEMEMSNQKFSKDEEKIKFLEIKIQKRENLVQDLTQTISKKDKEIQQLNKILEDRHGAIESIDGAFTTALYKATVAVSNGNKIGIVEAREELKAALKRVLFTSSEEVTDTLRGISSFSKEDLLDEVQRLRNELQSKENNIQILEQQSAERSQQVQNLQCSLNSLQEEISKSAKLHSNLYVERNIKVAQLQHPIQDTHGEMEELVGERDSTSEEMEKSFKRIINNLHLKDSTIRELEQRLKNAFEHKNEEIQRLKRELISSNEAIKSHKEENEALNLQIFQLKEERNHFEMDLKLKNEQFIELTIKIENLAEQLKVSEHKKSELDRFLKEKEKCFQEIVNSLNETHKELNDKKMMLEQLQGKFKFTSNEMELYKNHVNLLQYSLSKTEHNLRIRNEELALAFENIEMLKAQKKTSFINEVVCLTEPLRHVEECEMKVIKKQDDKEVIDLENTKNELNEKHVALTVQELNNKPTELSALTNYHCYLQDCLEDMKQSLAEKTDLIGIANRKIEELNREIEHLSVKLQKEGEKKGQLIIDENSIILCPSQLKEKMISTSDVSSRVIGSHETSCQQVEDINKEVNLIENAVLDKNSCICKLHSALNAKKEEVVFANKQIESLSEHLNCVKVELVKRNKELDKIFSEFTEQKKGKDKMNMNDSLLKEGKQRNIHQEKVVGFSNTITSDFPHLTSGNHVLQDKLKQCTQQQTILQNQITRWKDELLWLKSVKSQNEARSDLVETVLSQAQSEPSHKNESQTDDKCLGSTTSPFFHVQEQKEHETLSSELYVESSQVYRLKDLLSQAHLQIQSLHVQLENSKSQVRKQTSLALYYESQLKKAEIFSISRSEGDITKVTDHKDFVGILLLPETNKVLLNHSVSQPNINLAVQPNSRKNERSKSLLSTSASCKLPNDKVSESYYLWRQLQSHNLSKFGHSDNVCNLKKEVFVLVLRVEQLEKKAQKKLENFNNASVQVDEEEKLQNQLFYSQRVCELLQFQLEELTNLLERLLSHDANGQPSPRLWTPECISRVRQFLSESRKLSNCLSHSLLENNIIHSGIHNCALEIQPDLSTFPDLKLNTYSTKQVTSLETEKQQLQEDVKSKILEAHKPRKKKAHAGFQKIKSHLQNIEGLSEILHNDLSVLQELSGQVMAKVSELGSPEEKFKTKEVISRELMEEHHQYLKILQEKLDKVITSNENLTEKLKGKLDFRHVGPHGSMQKNVRDLDTKYKIAIERVNKYKQELVAKTSMERELQDTLSQYKIDAIHKEQELASCQKELTSCRSLLQEMEREIKEKEVAYTKLMDEKDQLEKEMSSRGHLHQQVHMRLQHLVENITDLRSRLLEKDQQSKHSEDMRAVMENELEARQKECKQVQNWNLRLQKEIKEKEVQCKDLEKKNEKLEKQNLTLETLVQQTGKHLNELEEKYKRSTEKEQKYVCLEKEMIRKDMDMRDLINRNENLHTQLILKEKQVDCLEEDKSLLNFKILELQEQSHTSNETIFQLRAELISSQEKTDKTCSELEQKLQNSQIYSETKASEAEKQHLISQHQLTEMYRKCTWLEEQLWSRDDRVQKLTEKASWLECEIQLKQKELEISTEKCFKLEKGLKDETEQFETRRKDLEQQIKIKEQEVIELAETEQDLKLKLKLRDEELKKLNDRNIELQETIHERELQFTEAVSEKSELEIKVNNLEEEMKHLKQSRSKPDGKDDFSGIRLAEFLKDKSRLEEELNTTQQRLEEVTQLNKCLQLELKAADKLGVQKEDLASVEDQAEETNKTLLLELVEELQPLRIALTKSTDFNRRLHRDIKQCTSRKEGINSSTQGLGSEQSISPASTLSLASTGSYTHTTNTQSESLEPSSPESSLSSAGDKNPYFHLSGFREPINHPTHWTFKNGSENKTHTDMGASSIRKELHGDHLLNSPTTTDASSSEGSLQHHISTYDAENNELCEKPFIRQCSVSSGDYETLSLTVLPKDILDHYPIKQTKSLESSDGSCHQSSTEKEGFRHDSNGTELSVTGRPCNSSPDLGIESDPNHEGGDREEPVFTTWNKLAVAVSSKRSVTIQLVRKRKTNENSKINRTFAGEQLPLDTAGLSGHGFSASVPELGEGEPHATCRLKDYQLLKKEIRESLVLLRGVIAQNLEYNTLKDIYSSCSDVDRCLEKSWNIINCFQLASLPSKKAVRSFAVSSLNKENQKLQEELSEVKKQLEETTKKLAVVKREKDGMERAITRQLTKTCLVLQQAKGNLAGDGKSTKYPVGII
ncbi:CDK5 regulatory subunit-associated protein 2-like isoform X2 [Limulus polyphemus]|uniref:CDK5 regulatory subunit-associated protein 2-like isoform X2 n=1 Tax=Limulus polyphemus TaxID=6850 RepID=A0ABM1BKG1_LIMPO|nr:CDK5 regulatory subunit-associated protein 2-like isoform X2 [Limulus polyphemus]